jgi:hypothetical protein
MKRWSLQRSLGRIWMRPTLVLAGVLLLALAACASGGEASTGGGTPTPIDGTPTPPLTTGGCPNPTAIPKPGQAANLVLTMRNANQTTAISQGQTLEIRLPDTTRWILTGFTSGLLVLQQPAGFVDAATHTCVWRFLAQAPGSAVVSFNGRPICKPGQMCPQYILALRFALAVR